MLNELGLRFGRCTDNAKAVLKKKGNDEPTSAQIKKSNDRIEEEHQAIMFLYNTDRSQYGNLIKQMENDMLQARTISKDSS